MAGLPEASMWEPWLLLAPMRKFSNSFTTLSQLSQFCRSLQLQAFWLHYLANSQVVLKTNLWELAWTGGINKPMTVAEIINPSYKWWTPTAKATVLCLWQGRVRGHLLYLFFPCVVSIQTLLGLGTVFSCSSQKNCRHWKSKGKLFIAIHFLRLNQYLCD